MPDLITVANDLKNMPDQWLAQQMTNPSGNVPPWLVASEVQRREKLRSGASKAQAPQSSVSQDLIKSLFAKIPPTAGLGPPTQGPGNAPPGMPPVNLTPPAGGMGSAPPGGPPAAMRMPGTPGMAKGGRVRYATGSAVEDDYLTPSYDDEMSALYPDEEADNGGRPSAPVPRPGTSTAIEDAQRILGNPGAYSSAAVEQAKRFMEGQQRAPASGGRPSAFAPRSAPAKAPPAPNYDDTIAVVAKRYNLPPDLIRKQLQTESRGDPKAISPKNARGLMQVKPDTAKEYGIFDPSQLNDPAINIDVGAHYLRDMIDRYHGDVNLGLAAYNAGPGAVDKYKGVPPYKETQDYVQKIMNADRQRLGLQPTTTPPPALRSRLLQPQPAPAPAPTREQQIAQATAKALDQREYQNNGIRESAPPDAPPPPPAAVTAVTAVTPPAPVAPMAPKPEPLHQSWTPPEDAGVKGLQDRINSFSKAGTLEDRLKAVHTPEAIAAMEAEARGIFGKQRDYSKYEKALDEMMAVAKKRMHPSIGDSLIAFGSALMANKNHNFGVAAGEATQHSFGVMQLLQQQGAKDYLEATRAGVALQDKIDDYNVKVGQYKMQRVAARESGVVQDYRAEQQHIGRLQDDLVKSKAAFDAKMATPMVQQNLAMAILNEHGIQLDPQINDPMKQLIATGNREWVEQAQNAGKAAASVKAPPIPEQQMDSAVRRTLQGKGLPLPPTNRLATMQDAPLELHDAITKLAGDMGAVKTISVQEKTAEAAMQSMSPEYLGSTMLQTGKLPSNFPRGNYILVAQATKMALDWMKGQGYGPQAAAMERIAAEANQGALGQMVKINESVEAFSQTTEKNMAVLEKVMGTLTDYGAPILNTPIRELGRQWSGDPRVSALEASLKSVQAEVTKVLNSAQASGAITQSERDDIAEKLGPGSTIEGLRATLGIWRQEMLNRRETYAEKVKDLTHRSVAGQTGATQQAAPAAGKYRNLMKRGNITIGVGADNKWHNVATDEVYQ